MAVYIKGYHRKVIIPLLISNGCCGCKEWDSVLNTEKAETWEC